MSAFNIENLGMGLGTRLVHAYSTWTCMWDTRVQLNVAHIHAQVHVCVAWLTLSLAHYHAEGLISFLHLLESFLQQDKSQIKSRIKKFTSTCIVSVLYKVVTFTFKASFSFLHCNNALSRFSISFCSWAMRGRSSATEEGDWREREERETETETDRRQRG